MKLSAYLWDSSRTSFIHTLPCQHIAVLIWQIYAQLHLRTLRQELSSMAHAPRNLLGQLVHIRAESLAMRVAGTKPLCSYCTWISRSSELNWWATCHRKPETSPLQNEHYTAVSSPSRIMPSHILPLSYCPMPPTSPKLFIPCSTQDAQTSLETGKTNEASGGCTVTVQPIGLTRELPSQKLLSFQLLWKAAVGLRRSGRSIDPPAGRWSWILSSTCNSWVDWQITALLCSAGKYTGPAPRKEEDPRFVKFQGSDITMTTAVLQSRPWGLGDSCGQLWGMATKPEAEN